MPKRRFLAITLFVMIIPVVTGQDLPSVDPDTARLQIEQFENENRELRSRIQNLSDQNETISSNVETWTSWINGIETVEERLDEQVAELRNSLQNVGSKSVVERAQTALERYATLASLLESKREELANRITEAQNTLVTNKETISLYQTRIEQNQENIELLNAAIAQSKDSEQLINSQLDALDALMQNARNLLQLPDSE